MTQNELCAILTAMREEIRSAVQEEVRATMREEIRSIVQEELSPIREQLDEMQEDTQITRGAVNALCDWADHVAVVTPVTFPVKKAE